MVSLLSVVDIVRGIREVLCNINFKGAVCLEGKWIRVYTFSGVYKPLHNYFFLEFSCLLNADPMGRLDYA